MTVEIHQLQRDMFTSELVDNRTRHQKEADARRHDWTQMNMFSIQEAPVGILRAKPVVDIDDLPSPPLILQREDPRSDEEKDTVLRREAEALTVKMFAEENNDVDQDERVEDSKEEKKAVRSDMAHDPKQVAYLTLIEVMQEQITTTWIDQNYQQRFANQLSLAILNAIEAGLTSHEVATAMQIGRFMGEHQKIQQEADKALDKPKRILIPVKVEVKVQLMPNKGGYRKRARQKQLAIRAKLR